MVFLWRIPRNYPEEMIGEYLRKESPDRFLFLSGEKVSKEIGVPRIRFEATKAKLSRFQVLPNSSMVPLVSEGVCELFLRICPNNVQLVPAEILTYEGVVSGYSLINVITLVACINHADSLY